MHAKASSHTHTPHSTWAIDGPGETEWCCAFKCIYHFIGHILLPLAFVSLNSLCSFFFSHPPSLLSVSARCLLWFYFRCFIAFSISHTDTPCDSNPGEDGELYIWMVTINRISSTFQLSSHISIGWRMWCQMSGKIVFWNEMEYFVFRFFFYSFLSAANAMVHPLP